MHKVKSILFVLVLAAAIGCTAAFLHFLTNDQGKYEIRYTGTEYVPRTLSVPIGTTVTFTNTSDSYHWPASDMHPNHAIYSAFDPLRGLAPGEAWEFTFNEIGNWAFHNHLQSYLGGRIFVHEPNKPPVEQCDVNPNSQSCWTTLLEEEIETGGPQAALKTFASLYTEHAEFSEYCHRFAHDVGLKTYVSYGADFEWPAEVAYCNAGFIHGFLEGYLNDETNLSKIDDFCTNLTNKLSDDFPQIELQCRHGIGHGYGEHLLYTHPELWNDPETLYKMSSEGCVDTNHDETTQMVCVYGAMTVILGINTPTDETEVKNVFSLCEKETEHYIKDACYWATPKFIIDVFDRDPDRTLQGLTTYFPSSDTAYYPQTITSVTNILARPYLSKDDSEIISICRRNFNNVEEQQTCLTGFIEGLLFSGEPEKEHLRTVSLCNSDLLSTEEQQQCHNTVVRVTGGHHSKLLNEVCSNVPLQTRETIELCNQ